MTKEVIHSRAVSGASTIASKKLASFSTWRKRNVRKKAKKYISVNKHVIAKNVRHGTNDPPIRVTVGKNGPGVYCYRAEIKGPSKILYSADKPILKCGARLVIETESDVIAHIDP